MTFWACSPYIERDSFKLTQVVWGSSICVAISLERELFQLKNQWATRTIISRDKDLINPPTALSQSVVSNIGYILETCHFTIKEYISKLQGLQFYNINCETNSEISCNICLSTYLFLSFISVKRGTNIRTKGSTLAEFLDPLETKSNTWQDFTDFKSTISPSLLLH